MQKLTFKKLSGGGAPHICNLRAGAAAGELNRNRGLRKRRAKHKTCSDGGANEVVAAIGEQAPRTSCCQTGRFAPAAATHTAGRSERGWPHPDPPGPRAPLRLRHRLHDPLYGSFVGDQGAFLCRRRTWRLLQLRLENAAKMCFTVPPNGVAKLHFGAHFRRGRRNGGGHGGLGAAAVDGGANDVTLAPWARCC